MSTPELNLTGVLEAPRPSAGLAPARSPRRREPAAPAAPRAQLPPVDPRLDGFVNDLMGEASKRTGYTYKLGEGSRTPEQQAGKVARGVSWTYNSAHMHGRGRDVLAYDSEGNYITDGSHEAYKALGDVYAERAPSSPVRVKWGVVRNGSQVDPGHFELDDDGEESAAPALKLDGVLEPPLKLDGVLEPVDDEEVVSTEATVDSSTGRALALDDARRRQRVDASTVQLNASPTSAPRAASQRPDVRTMEGRAQRDRRAALERKPGSYLEVSVPVSDIARADAPLLVLQAYASAAEARGVPREFVDEWMKTNAPTGYRLHNGRGEELTAADAYDDASKGVRLRIDATHVSKIVDDYKASRGTLTKLSDWASSDETSPGEKVLDAAGAVAAPVVKGAGYVARPFQAASAGVFGGLRGNNPLRVAYQTLTTGETPAEGTNPVGNYLRDSAVLNRINPRLGRLLGGAADVVLDPANLIGLGLLGKGAKAVSGAGRIGRAAEEVNALGRSLGFLERGLVEARPLGLGGEAVAGGGEVAALEGRLSRVLEVTRKLKAGEALTPEEAALHAEVVAAAEAAPSAAVRGEQLKYASERAAHYEDAARSAKTEGARRTARELADDYAGEAERLRTGGGGPAAEGYDLADASAPRFKPRPEDPAASPWGRGLRTARDVAQLPKVKAGFDLSATGRQGLAQVAAHPSYLKEAFAHQVKAFASEDAFNDFAQAIRNRPDFELMNDSGLFLSSVGPEAEEAFASNLAQKIPGVRASDRAYSAALDSIRTQAWDNYTGSLPAHLKDNPETLKAVSELINISTGRGVVPILDRSALGKKVIDALNVPFFSPRNTASKFNLISPARLAKNMMSAETRPVALLQLRDASRGLTSLGTTLGLLHLAGLDVSVNPYSSDFGKVRVGKAIYDLTGGEGYTVRYLAQMARTAANEARGKRIPKGAGLTELTRRYLRTQLQPLAATGADWWTGKTIDGRKVTTASAALNLITPFVVDDVIKGFQAEGWLGAVKATPGVLGVGVNFYDAPKEGKGAHGSPVEVQSNRLNLEGERESSNVEDLRGPDEDSPHYTAEDHAALVDERREAGEPEIDEARAGAVALALDSMPERNFGSYAKSLDEAYQLGRVGEAVTYAGEYGSKALAASGLVDNPEAHEQHAEAQEFMRMLAREKRLRPVQFYFDASAGRYGSRLRDEVLEGVYYPENHLPSSGSSPLNLDGIVEPAPASSSSPAHDEIRGAVEGAAPDAEPTFRDFPEGMGESGVPRASMPQVKGKHRGAMVQFLRARGIAHAWEEVPADSLRPSQREYSPEKVSRALSYEGAERPILISSDGHVADGHHQWLSALHKNPHGRIPVIRLDAPINQLLLEMARFPSSDVDDASA